MNTTPIRKVIARTIDVSSLNEHIRVYIDYFDRSNPRKTIVFINRDSFLRFQEWVLNNHIDNDIWLWN